MVGKPRLKSWLLCANLKGVASPDGVGAKIQTLLQSAGMGSTEMTAIGQAGVGMLPTLVQLAVAEAAGCLPFWRQDGDGIPGDVPGIL